MTHGSGSAPALLACALLLPLVLFASCGGQNGNGQGANAVVYDPSTDPLVNPPSLFEPAPADWSLINRDDTLYLTLNGNPNSLNPLFISSTVEFYLSGCLYDQLFSFGADLQFMVNEHLVESCEASHDYLAPPGR